ncbi:MAG: hypothetical protein AAGA06_02340 [Pseudomonadota bacterium]
MIHTIFDKRRFRHPSELWTILLLLLGGPLNPVAWWLNTPEMGRSFFLSDVVVFHLIPCTVMTLTTVWILNVLGRFDLGFIVLAVVAGLAIAVLTAPLVLAITMWLGDGHGGITSILTNFVLTTIVGWLFLVIPYFAISKGVPCALMVIALCIIFTSPDADAVDPHQEA